MTTSADQAPAVRPPVPPFDETSARAKVQAAEDAWNTRDPERVAAAYTPDSEWRNRSEFLRGRDEIIEASINDVEIDPSQRRILGPRTDAERGTHDRPIPLR